MLLSILRRLDNVKIAISALLVLLILVGLGNLWATYNAIGNFKTAQEQEHSSQVRAQQQASRVVEGKLCNTFHKLGAVKPPAGDPMKDPHLAFDMNLHSTLVELGADVGCPPVRPHR